MSSRGFRSADRIVRRNRDDGFRWMSTQLKFPEIFANVCDVPSRVVKLLRAGNVGNGAQDLLGPLRLGQQSALERQIWNDRI